MTPLTTVYPWVASSARKSGCSGLLVGELAFYIFIVSSTYFKRSVTGVGMMWECTDVGGTVFGTTGTSGVRSGETATGAILSILLMVVKEDNKKNSSGVLCMQSVFHRFLSAVNRWIGYLYPINECNLVLEVA